MKFFSLILLFAFFILETSLTTLPLILLCLICLMVILRQNWIFFYGFLFGALFDLVSFKTIGITSGYFVIFLFLILLYQKKFEISTNYFVLASSLIGSFGFLLIIGYNNSIILASLTSCLFAIILFNILKRFIKIDSNSSKNS